MNGQVLIIEDDVVNSRVLRERFEADGMIVNVAFTGVQGIDAAVRLLPQAILISTSLPDMSGISVAHRLRQIARTQHSYLMLLADVDSHAERLVVLDQGADDFVTAPYDSLEVMLRVRNALRRASTANTLDPTTGLPAGKLIQNQMHRLLNEPHGTWSLMRFKVTGLDVFRELHGFAAAEDFLRSVTLILAEALSIDDVAHGFLGYSGNDDFIVITDRHRAASLAAQAQKRFQLVLQTHYDATELAQGHVLLDGAPSAVAALQIKSVDAACGPFYDVRGLTEALA